MQCRAFVQHTGVCRNSVTLSNCLYMTATDLDANTGTTGTKSRRTDTSHILSQCQGCTTTKEPKRLAVTLVDFHTGHTHIVLGGGEELHSEGGTQIRFSFNDFVDSFYIHIH